MKFPGVYQCDSGEEGLPSTHSVWEDDLQARGVLWFLGTWSP